MKKIVRLVVFTVLLGCMFSSSFASIKHSCNDLSGDWKGQAELKWFFFTCNYESKAVVHSGNPADAEVVFTKVSGPFLCPSEGTHNVSISCDNNKLEMKDEKIDVSGQLSEDGHSASLAGNFYVLFRYHPFKLVVNKV